MSAVPQPTEVVEGPLPEQHAGTPRLETVIVQNRRARWTFPVVAGLPEQLVMDELCARFAAAGGRDGVVMASDDTRVTYPAGAFPFASLNHIPPIGWKGAWPIEVVDESQSEVPSSPVTDQTQSPRQAPSQNSWTKQPPVFGQGVPTSPLPNNPARPSGEQGAMQELDFMLAGWRQRHQLSSAEYYLYVVRMLQFHAGSLVNLERQPRRNSDAPSRPAPAG